MTATTRLNVAGKLAWGLWGLTAALTVAYPLLLVLVAGQPLEVFAFPGAETISSIVSASIGVLVISRLPRHPIGWLLLGVGFFIGLNATGSLYTIYAVFVAAHPAALGTFTGWLSGWDYVPSLGGLALAILLFPDGRLPSPRWRPLGWFIGATVMGSILLTAVGQQVFGVTFIDHSGQMGGVSASGHPTYDALYEVAIASNALGLILAGTALGLRFRSAQSDQRQQLRWVASFGAVLPLVFVPLIAVTSGLVPQARPVVFGLIGVAMIMLPVAIGLSVIRYRLYDIDIVISRTVLFAALAIFVTAVYLAVVVGVGALVGSGDRPNLLLSIGATAIVAVAFQPVRSWAQALANRIAYGKRATPYEVLSDLSAGLRDTFAGEDILPRVARVLAEGTGATSVTLWVRLGDELRVAAEWPDHERPTRRDREALPVTGQELPSIPGVDRAVAVLHQGELLGALALTKRTGEPLTPIEETLVDDLAAQAGLVLRNAGLANALQARLEDLRTSRQRLVAAQDQERRRLERNLHDGAQQNLVALKVKLGLAKALALKDPQQTTELLDQLSAETNDAIETLRDLARGIYPPLLADKGLAAALESQARKATVAVSVDADGIGRYPQAVEAAIYFCTLEALQNVQKYSGASQATVRLRDAAGELRFEVEDDGVGFDPSTTVRGSGTQNMADRLDALCGIFEVQSQPGSGTTIRGVVPLASDPSDEEIDRDEVGI